MNRKESKFAASISLHELRRTEQGVCVCVCEGGGGQTFCNLRQKYRFVLFDFLFLAKNKGLNVVFWLLAYLENWWIFFPLCTMMKFVNQPCM